MEPFFVNRSEVADIVRYGAPNFCGNKIQIYSIDSPRREVLDNRWDRGTRSFYTFINLKTNKPNYLKDTELGQHSQVLNMEAGEVLVQHRFVNGNTVACRIYAFPQDIGSLKPREGKNAQVLVK